VIEILLTFGLLIPRLRAKFASMIAWYFFLLIPFHIYMLVYRIPIAGNDSIYLLAARLVLQWPLIYLANSLNPKSWSIKQTWNDVVFINYFIDPKDLKALVPFELDLFEGKAVLSIVPFKMTGIRFPFFFGIPVLNSLWELNLRTYVIVNGKPGIYFFTLEANSSPGVWIGRTIFELPYIKSKLKASVSDTKYFFKHDRGEFHFQLEGNILEKKVNMSFDRWCVERYSFFLKNKKGQIYEGVAKHEPWTLSNFKITNMKDQLFFSFLGKKNFFNEQDIVSTAYSKKLEVHFHHRKKILAK
nr:DUF2071 domain-containing protein [Bacteriovoracaceae bacterium]